MAKKKSSPSTAATRRKTESKDTIRALHDLEAKILDLMQRHATLAESIQDDPKAGAKLLARLRDAEEMAKLNRKLGRKTTGPMADETVAAIFREMAHGIETSQRRFRVAFLGPLHSYSHLATLKKFGESAELVPVRTIAAVFEEVSSGQVDAGLVPIENSTDGRIVDTLDRLTQASVKICGEVPLRIHHNLLGIGSREDVTQVCSKPQAISQCRDWLESHLPAAKITAMSSTTAAAELAASDQSVAAVASHQAGVQYGLKVLAKNIEDRKDNITRFAVIGQEAATRTGNDKTSIMFELAHEPGALADAMIVFKKNRLNLTWIESFPKPGSPNEYLFFIELLGYQTDLRVRRALAALEKKCVRLEVLGSYAQSKVV